MDDGEDTRTEEQKIEDAREWGYEKGFREGSALANKETRREVVSTFQRIGEDLDNNKILTAVAALRVAWNL